MSKAVEVTRIRLDVEYAEFNQEEKYVEIEIPAEPVPQVVFDSIRKSFDPMMADIILHQIYRLNDAFALQSRIIH